MSNIDGYTIFMSIDNRMRQSCSSLPCIVYNTDTRQGKLIYQHNQEYITYPMTIQDHDPINLIMFLLKEICMDRGVGGTYSLRQIDNNVLVSISSMDE